MDKGEKVVTILITGASGFVGSHLVEEALRQGYETWAGVRGSSRRDHLQQSELHFAQLTLSDPEALDRELQQYKHEMGGHGWDYIVHAAGTTKCLDSRQFYATNTQGTRYLVEGLRRAGMMPRRFVFLSSLSVMGDIYEKSIQITDVPQPNTQYGRSKLQAEEYLRRQTDLPLTILRPTGVYGPREQDYAMLVQSIRRHIDVMVGFRPQFITFIHVYDLVAAVYQSMHSAVALGQTYLLSDGQTYSSLDFSRLVQQHLGNPWVLRLRLPLALLYCICCLSEGVSHLTGRINALNRDKYRILAQRNWRCDITPARRDFGFDPQWPLDRGVPTIIK